MCAAFGAIVTGAIFQFNRQMLDGAAALLECSSVGTEKSPGQFAVQPSFGEVPVIGGSRP